MKFGDQVIFTENGKEFSATVLSARILDHHLGENDEPLLHLGFFAPVLAPDGKNELNVVGTARQNELVQFRADVAHESHEFGAAAAQAKLTGIYPGGRWREDLRVSFDGKMVSTEEGAVETPAVGEVKAEVPAAEEQKSTIPEGGSEEPPPTVN